jgi:hypothetical protein
MEEISSSTIVKENISILQVTSMGKILDNLGEAQGV